MDINTNEFPELRIVESESEQHAEDQATPESFPRLLGRDAREEAVTTTSAESAACEESTSVIDPDEEEEREDEDRAVVLENLAQWIFESVEGNLVDQSQWCRNIDLTENDESEFSQWVTLTCIETLLNLKRRRREL